MATTRVLKTLSIYRQEGKEGVVVDQASKVGEAASQDYKAGAPLEYTSGTIEALATGGADTGLVIGIAAKDATGTTGAAVPYYEANDYNLFEGSLINGTNAYTLLGTEIGTAYGLIDSGDNWYVDISNTTQKKVVVVGLIDPVSDINPRVIVRFIGSMQARVLQS
jgi:hypothetical protein